MLSSLRPNHRVPRPSGPPPAARPSQARPQPCLDEVKLSGAKPAEDPFSDLEDTLRIPGYNFVFGPLAVAVARGARAWQWLRRKLSHPQPAPPAPPLAYQLADHPQATLKRPVVFVSGFNMKPDSFDHLTRKLTEGGANGGHTYFVRDGRFFEDFECSRPCTVPPNQESRVFVASFHTTGETPDQTAPQLDQDLRAIQAACGSPKIDAVGYSMGGLASRVYLDHGGEAIGRLAMLATPNQGSALAKLSHWLLEIDEQGMNVDPILHWKSLRPQDVPALHWLRPSNGGSPNLHLLDLNSRWPSQRSRLEDAESIGSASLAKTYSTYIWPVKGDGTVTAGSLQLPGLPRKLFTTPERGSHGQLPMKAETYDELHRFFAWGAPDLT